MSEQQTAEATATETEATTATEQQTETKPTETVDFWKNKSREQEKRAKENADAARELAELKESQKTDSEKAADRLAKAEAEVASVPSKVADALRDHLVKLHEIDQDDVDLFLTASDPELLLKQVDRLVGQQSDKRKTGPRVRREGETSSTTRGDEREFLRELTSQE